jgi:hypothetical protein
MLKKLGVATDLLWSFFVFIFPGDASSCEFMENVDYCGWVSQHMLVAWRFVSRKGHGRQLEQGLQFLHMSATVCIV